MLLIPLELGVFFQHKLVGSADVLFKQIHLTMSVLAHRCVHLCTLQLALSLRFVFRLTCESIRLQREERMMPEKTLVLKLPSECNPVEWLCRKLLIVCVCVCVLSVMFYRKKAKPTYMSHVKLYVPYPYANLNYELCRQ